MLLLLLLLLLVGDLFFNIQNSNKKKNAMASVTYVAQTRLSVLLSVIYASRASQVLFNVLSLHTLLIIWPDSSMCLFIKCAHRLLFTYAFGVTETTIFYLLDFIFIFLLFFPLTGKNKWRTRQQSKTPNHTHVIVSVYAMVLITTGPQYTR